MSFVFVLEAKEVNMAWNCGVTSSSRIARFMESLSSFAKTTLWCCTLTRRDYLSKLMPNGSPCGFLYCMHPIVGSPLTSVKHGGMTPPLSCQSAMFLLISSLFVPMQTPAPGVPDGQHVFQEGFETTSSTPFLRNFLETFELCLPATSLIMKVPEKHGCNPMGSWPTKLTLSWCLLDLQRIARSRVFWRTSTLRTKLKTTQPLLWNYAGRKFPPDLPRLLPSLPNLRLPERRSTSPI